MLEQCPFGEEAKPVERTERGLVSPNLLEETSSAQLYVPGHPPHHHHVPSYPLLEDVGQSCLHRFHSITLISCTTWWPPHAFFPTFSLVHSSQKELYF